ncbi:MAG: PD40 domain-containing protein, partial [Caldilineaceae bacterium]|nr:PD40 domain-containing protein [Caldilineaceae bacterium]
MAELPVATNIGQAPAPNVASNVNTPSSVVSPATGQRGKLVFSDGQGGVIYLYELASGALRTLTSGIDPALSPDGSQVLFTRSGGENGIYVINTDGSGEHKIFGERELLTSPKWSPDGQWIVFSRSDGAYKCVDTGRALCPSVQQLLGSIPSGLSAEQLAAVQARRASTL